MSRDAGATASSAGVRPASIAAAVALVTALTLLLAGTARAQTQPQPQTPPRPPAPLPDCSGPEFRQFDFWLGDWNVTVGGNTAGTNSITSELSGCFLHEHWQGTKGGGGESMNFYDRQSKSWNQVWVSSTGSVLRLSGGLDGGRMVLGGSTSTPDGKTQRHRITWTPNAADGTVRQFWESSSDDGKTWTVAFDGLYARK